MSYTPNEYPANIARGLIPGSIPFGSYGKRIATGAESGVLWSGTPSSFAFPPAAGVQMSVVSTSANDAAAGTGIRSIDIYYLDASLAPQFETVTMNGLAAVLTVATNIRFIQSVHIATVGANKVAAGTITISNGGTTYSRIEIGDIRSASSVRMVPAGQRFIVTSFFAGSSSGAGAASTIIQSASPQINTRDFTTSNILVPRAASVFQDGSGSLTLTCPFAFTAGQSIGLIFNTDKAATVVGQLFGWLENV